SVTSSVYDYEVYHGRTYHSYDAGSYLCPNDKLEQGRLHLQHRALGRLFGDRLHLAPLQTGKTSGRILDVGTGTGEWAICMADAYPSWQVIGTDLSPIQPLFVPPNLAFYIENAREPWVCSEPFDYIHTRATLHAGCWGDFKQEVIEQAFKNLHPGGWLESQEMGCLVQSDDGTLPLDGPLSRWIADVNSASAKIGRPRDVADRMAQWYSEVGFVDVEQKLFKIPVNSWLQGTGLENIGRLWGLNLHEAVEPLSVRLFDVALDRDATATEEMLVDVRKELENPFVHAYTAFYVVYGRKP
ncbi:methyltransferase domain-containing protein, partial [Mariannaea sp. PMI_226]